MGRQAQERWSQAKVASKPGCLHRPRPALASRHPVHVTLKLRPEIENLRTKKKVQLISGSPFEQPSCRGGFRLCALHDSKQSPPFDRRSEGDRCAEQRRQRPRDPHRARHQSSVEPTRPGVSRSVSFSGLEVATGDAPCARLCAAQLESTGARSGPARRGIRAAPARTSTVGECGPNLQQRSATKRTMTQSPSPRLRFLQVGGDVTACSSPAKSQARPVDQRRDRYRLSWAATMTQSDRSRLSNRVLTSSVPGIDSES